MRKKVLLIAVGALMCGASASGQLVEVASIDKIATVSAVDMAEISPDGAQAIMSNGIDMSLTLVNLSSGSERKVTDNGVIMGLSWADNSQEVAYIRMSTDATHRSYKEARHLNVVTLADEQALAPTRKFEGMSMRGGGLTVVSDCKALRPVKATKTQTSATKEIPTASVHYGQLMITRDGVTTAINPQGREGRSYLWPQVSPDGTRVLYYLGATGTFVCDIDGSNVRRVPTLRAARWLDNNLIVGMRDSDDGYRITSSAIIVATIDGQEQQISTDEHVAVYPSVSADGSKVAFTSNGSLYVINLNR